MLSVPPNASRPPPWLMLAALACMACGCDNGILIASGTTSPESGPGVSGVTRDGGLGAEGGASDATSGLPGDARASSDATATGDAEAGAGVDATPDVCEGGSTALAEETRFNGVLSASAHLVSADLNGDGRLDMAIADSDDSYVLVRLGNGDGTFKPTVVLPSGVGPLDIVASDVNGDGKVDLVTANSGVYHYASNSVGGAGVSVLLGRGDGTFETHVDYAPAPGVDAGPNFEILSVAVGDVTGDGVPDLVTAAAASQVWVFPGTGSGKFGTPSRYDAAMADVFTVAVADLDGDGTADVVAGGVSPLEASAYGSGEVTVLLGGSGGLTKKMAFATGTLLSPTLNDERAVESIVLADLDGDHKLDIAAAVAEGQGVVFCHGHGDGTFDPYVEYIGGVFGYSIRTADMNGDGAPDLVVGNGYGATVLLGTGSGSFAPIVANPNPVTYYEFTFVDVAFDGMETGMKSVALGDFDGDGKPDVAAGIDLYDVILLHNTGDGHLQPLSRPHHAEPTSLAVGDLDGDGKLDIAVGNAGSQNLGIVLGNGDGTFQPEVDLALGDSGATTQGVYPEWLGTADLNRDGKTDLVSGTNFGSLAVLLGQGGGAFQAAPAIPGAVFPTIADVNGDGTPDIVTLEDLAPDGGPANATSIAVFLGRGDGTFQQGARPSAGNGQLFQVATGDFDGDGHTDLAALSASNTIPQVDSVLLLSGNGDGTFGAPVTYALDAPDAAPQGDGATLVAADLNGDGRTDLVVAELAQNDVAILLAHSDGTLAAPRHVSIGTAYPDQQALLDDVKVADLNGDGKLDIAALHSGPAYQHDAVLVLYGAGDGTFTAGPDRAIGYEAQSLAIGRFTSRSTPDIVTANRGTNDMSFLPGAPACALGR